MNWLCFSIPTFSVVSRLPYHFLIYSIHAHSNQFLSINFFSSLPIHDSRLLFRRPSDSFRNTCAIIFMSDYYYWLCIRIGIPFIQYSMDTSINIVIQCVEWHRVSADILFFFSLSLPIIFALAVLFLFCHFPSFLHWDSVPSFNFFYSISINLAFQFARSTEQQNYAFNFEQFRKQKWQLYTKFIFHRFLNNECFCPSPTTKQFPFLLFVILTLLRNNFFGICHS